MVRQAHHERLTKLTMSGDAQASQTARPELVEG